MSAGDYDYLAVVFKSTKDTIDSPSGLWRRRGDELDYLSAADWGWHPGGEHLLPHPDSVVPVSAEQAEKLLADRQSFAKYWVVPETIVLGEVEVETTVFRQLCGPPLIEEKFGRYNEWIPTRAIRDFQVGGPHDVLDLERIDAATAERLIRETRGVADATDLLAPPRAWRPVNISEYRHFVTALDRDPDRPTGLWRRWHHELDHLSLETWTWRPADDLVPPDPLLPIDLDHVQALLADHQRFAPPPQPGPNG